MLFYHNYDSTDNSSLCSCSFSFKSSLLVFIHSLYSCLRDVNFDLREAIDNVKSTALLNLSLKTEE